MIHETTYLTFRREGYSLSGKTEVFIVNSRSSGDQLGKIKWYGPWRQYCFFPNYRTIFNRGCLKDINDYITTLMEARNQNQQLKDLGVDPLSEQS